MEKSIAIGNESKGRIDKVSRSDSLSQCKIDILAVKYHFTSS
jgi:hypothetical protein